jgi:peptide/nickel transport system substrate-binding protein
MPRVKRIVFDNTLSQKEAVELLKSGEGRVDVVTDLSPLETLRVAESPYASIVKNRDSLGIVVGLLNMRKPGSPWGDARVRQAANLAVNRADVIRYATNGNGVAVPALVPRSDFGYDPDLIPYPFDPGKARALLKDAGYALGPAISLIATEDLTAQATVIGRMLEQAGFKVTTEILDGTTYNRRTNHGGLEQPAEKQTWDLALLAWPDLQNFPLFQMYVTLALDGRYAWLHEPPELRRLYDEVLRTIDRDKQQELIRRMERHTKEQAYFLFLYNPIGLYAVNKQVKFVPYVTTSLIFADTSVTNQHWSLRNAGKKK